MKKISFLALLSVAMFSCKKQGPKSTLDKIIGTYNVTHTYISTGYDSGTTTKVMTWEIKRATVKQEAFIYNNNVYNISDGTWEGNELVYGAYTSAGWRTDTIGEFYRKLRFLVDEGRFVEGYGQYRSSDAYWINTLDGVKK